MPNPKQPVGLLLAKNNRSHLTKAEIEKRQAEELKVDLLDVEPPRHLNRKQKNQFIEIASKLKHIKIMTELDEEALARYVTTNEEYLRIDKLLQAEMKKKDYDIAIINQLHLVQDKLLKQVRALASDLGLTITSRARLVVPQATEEPKKNKFSKFNGDS